MLKELLGPEQAPTLDVVYQVLVQNGNKQCGKEDSNSLTHSCLKILWKGPSRFLVSHGIQLISNVMCH